MSEVFLTHDAVFAEVDLDMRDAARVSEYFLSKSVSAVDGQFGMGYAKQHAPLVKAMIESSVQVYVTRRRVVGGAEC